jgi:hypothetical protein
MHELAWAHSNSFQVLLGLLGRAPDPRKMRLCACAVVRRITGGIVEPFCRAAANVAELVVDQRAGKREIKTVRRALGASVEEALQRVRHDYADRDQNERVLQSRIENVPIVRLARGLELVLSTKDLDARSAETVARVARGFATPGVTRDPHRVR